MKRLISLSLLSLTLMAVADEMPSHRRLPNKGQNCVFQQAFQSAATTCGTRRYEVWNCVTPGSAFAAATQKSYLLAGEYGSDVGSECSPTYVVTSVNEGRTN